MKTNAELLAALIGIFPYAENEAYALSDLADSEIAKVQAEAAWNALDRAREAIEAARSDDHAVKLTHD